MIARSGFSGPGAVDHRAHRDPIRDGTYPICCTKVLGSPEARLREALKPGVNAAGGQLKQNKRNLQELIDGIVHVDGE